MLIEGKWEERTIAPLSANFLYVVTSPTPDLPLGLVHRYPRNVSFPLTTCDAVQVLSAQVSANH